jgi:hypothetical protein
MQRSGLGSLQLSGGVDEIVQACPGSFDDERSLFFGDDGRVRLVVRTPRTNVLGSFHDSIASFANSSKYIY